MSFHLALCSFGDNGDCPFIDAIRCFFLRAGKKNQPNKGCFGVTNVLESVLFWQPVYFCTVIYSYIGDFLVFFLSRINHALCLQYISLLCLRFHYSVQHL